MLPEELAKLLEKIRNSLDKVQRAALLRVVNSYKSTTRYLESDIDLLIKELSGAQLSVADVRKLKAYKRLMSNSAEALKDFSSYLGVDMRNEIDKMAAMGQSDAFSLLLSQGDELRGVLNKGANAAQLSALVNYLDPKKPLYGRLQKFSEAGAEYISQIILQGVTGGYNPATIARSIRDAYGMPLTDAMRMMRTVQIYSYRDASHLNYQNNRDVVSGWIWYAELDDLTCFPKGTIIKTLRGNIPIESVTTSDEVLTHNGQWKKVSATMQKEYKGLFVKISVLDTQIFSTVDHPFLVKKKGRLDWIRADEIDITDSIVIDPQYFGKERNHITGKLPVEWRIFDSINSMSSRFNPSSFSGISFSDRFLVVPIKAINFYDNINVWQKEINRIPPTRKTMFLNISNRHIFKTKSNVLFRFCLSSISSITSWTTKFLMFKSRNHSKIFTTNKTRNNNRRSSTDFRTITSIISATIRKSFSTSLTQFIDRVFSFTRNTTNIVSIGVRPGNRKFFIANWTYLCNLFRSITTFFTTIISWSALWIRKFFFTNFANRFNALAFSGVVALNRAIFASAFSSPSVWNRECFTTYRTSVSEHNTIISNLAKEVQSTIVFNLEVEDDYSYIANGIVVHNCMSCVAMHGTFHSVDETLNDHHNGRCVAVPVTKLSDPFIKDGEGKSWFEQQSEATQKQMMGAGKYDAWKAGKFEFSQLSKENENDVFGMMRGETPLKDLIGE